MTAAPRLTLRNAQHDDVAAIGTFGGSHIPAHYAPLIGVTAANNQVRDWWNDAHLCAAVSDGLIVVAEVDEQLVGVGQRGRFGDDNVIYKLYVHPQYRNSGLGPQLIAALVDDLPSGTTRLYLEHFAANDRAGSFYEREGFTVDRIEPSPSGDPALAVVWRAREVRAQERAPHRA